MQYGELQRVRRAQQLMHSVKLAKLGRWRQALKAPPTKHCLLPTQRKLVAMRPTRESIACSRPLNRSSRAREHLQTPLATYVASGVFLCA